ncbi:leucine-rich repeat receptor protein kinase MSL1-like [Momordica charantia]|uniref:Leucine-rich repeat receptor protein kinase MSL1-like n=1 Tax=Momordica charantia TaxID=3673 RepID=A0A6J1C8Z9_MOMCH|nr:leucine-rich repeat receptor protein kinase MSL1-like [Momordica charantia]
MKLSLASNVTHTPNYIAVERRALIEFKQSLSDLSGRLSSWVGDDYCRWLGITCDFISRKVTKIDLRNSLGFSILHGDDFDYQWMYSKGVLQEFRRTCLGGDISPSLLELKHLNYLDLSVNNFEGATIPYFFGMFKSLKYLNLSFAHFGGVIPPSVRNLSNLNYLDLHAYNLVINERSNAYRLPGENLQWLSGLSSLKYLDIGQVNLSSVQTTWIHVVNTLSSLSELHLGDCGISSFDDSIGFLNLTSLKVLDLSSNSISSSFSWLSNLTSLSKLDIGYNTFQGTIPRSFVKLKNLQYLDMSGTELGKFEDHIPSFLQNLCQLRYLSLRGNYFGGKLDEFFGSYSNCSQNNLETLYLSDNRLMGEIPKSLGKFEILRSLDLSNNELWGSLPNSIGNLLSLQILDVSYNFLNGTIPPSFGQLSELIEFRSFKNSWKLVLSEAQLMHLTKLERLVITQEENQHLVFKISYGWIPPFTLKFLYLENCLIGPQFPIWLQVQTRLTLVALSSVGISDFMPHEWISKISSHIIDLDLSNNMLKGNLSHLFTSQDVQSIARTHNLSEDLVPPRYPKLMFLYLHNNSLSGPIPSNIGDLMPHLVELDLSDNQLSGELLDNWDKLGALCIIDLGNNNLHGKIPKSIGLLTSLSALILSNNHLHGEIPKSLQNCSLLRSIDLSGNRLHGSLPSWAMPELRLLNLRSNFFSGTIPPQWCNNLCFLRILDLSNNNLCGKIPSCLSNWTTFISGDKDISGLNNYKVNGATTSFFHVEKTMLVMKGREMKYSSTLKYVLIIDLSSNKLSGEIPNEITKFVYLGTLNLSNNHFVGTIPENIGAMQQLETLDLSCNRLSGKIPASLNSLNFLSHLNLSFNNLTGSIPKGNHLETLEEPSIYEGNPLLCGSPVKTKCPWDGHSPNYGVPVISTSEEDEEIMFGFYISMAIGFPVGLNVLFFAIFTSRRRRICYFRLLDSVSCFVLEKIGFFTTPVRRMR